MLTELQTLVELTALTGFSWSLLDTICLWPNTSMFSINVSRMTGSAPFLTHTIHHHQLLSAAHFCLFTCCSGGSSCGMANVTRHAWRSLLSSALQGPSLAWLLCLPPPFTALTCTLVIAHALDFAALFFVSALTGLILDWYLHFLLQSQRLARHLRSPSTTTTEPLASIRSLTCTSITWTPFSTRMGAFRSSGKSGSPNASACVASASLKFIDCVVPFFALNVILLLPRSGIFHPSATR